MRLLYVAATRARSHLHLLGHTRDRSGMQEREGPRFAHLVDTILACGRLRHSKNAAESHRSRRLKRSLPISPQNSIAATGFGLASVASTVRTLAGAAPRSQMPSIEDESRDHVSFDWATDLQRHVGIVVHAMLQQMPTKRRGFEVRSLDNFCSAVRPGSRRRTTA